VTSRAADSFGTFAQGWREPVALAAVQQPELPWYAP
jgi:hypothetical protein